jgi:hypothetical protein
LQICLFNDAPGRDWVAGLQASSWSLSVAAIIESKKGLWALSDMQASRWPTGFRRESMRKLWLQYVKNALNIDLIFLTGY